ncbi:MAG: ABC transporter permease [Acidobacteria bacterium]|nr:ABC transporter permease [Acidobacteriota bacterium]
MKFWWPRRKNESDLEEEIQAHLQMSANDHVGRGKSTKDAQHSAEKEFGNVGLVKEITREAWGLRWLENFFQDARYGLRQLRRNPGFTAVAVLTLGLGIGANTAIFTLINAVQLKSLPVPKPEELVQLQWSVPLVENSKGSGKATEGRLWWNGNMYEDKGKTIGTPLSYPVFQEIRNHNHALSGIFAFAELSDQVNVVADGEPGLARGQMATGQIFTTLGIRPVAGRLFDENDDRPGASPVCVISAAYWKRRFGGDPGIAGKKVVVAGLPFTITGVTPPEFFGLQSGSATDIWVPLSFQPLVKPDLDPTVSMFTAADHWWLLVIGRLNPGLTAEQAFPGLNAKFQSTVFQGLAPKPDEYFARMSVELVPAATGLDELRRKFSETLFILMGLVGVVLLIACANVANLLLARATCRQKEIGVRLSLGASHGRLVRQLLTESLLLSAMGGVVGLLFAYWGSDLLVGLVSAPTDPLSLNLSPDYRVLGFTAAACIFTGFLFGLAPAWRSARLDLTTAVKQTTQSMGSGGARLGLGKILVVSQVALSLVLLFGAGLFVRTLVNLRQLDLGFAQDNVLIFGLNPTQSGYKSAALKDLYSRVQRSVASLPGVVSATSSWHLLLHGGRRSDTLRVPGYVSKSGKDPSVSVMPAGPDFFATMKIPFLQGRDFTERDSEHAPKVAIVNQAFVNLYFPGRNPIGQLIGLGDMGQETDVEIIGLVKDAKYDSLRREMTPTVYHPLRQAENIPYMYFEVRTAMDPAALVPAVRSAVASIDRNVPLFGVTTETILIDEHLLRERLFAKLVSGFSLLALLLACVGLYGILSYGVTRRTREIGIRMALGGQPQDILKMVLKETLLLVAMGVAMGVPVSLFATRMAATVLADMLYEVKPTDSATVAMATAMTIAVAVFAGFLPARRAARIDPMVALRYE